MFALNRRLAMGTIVMLIPTAFSGDAVAQDRSMRIFFDAGKSELSESARKIVDMVAEQIAPSASVKKITLVGSGDAAEANPDKLSQLRAVEVAKASVRGIGTAETGRCGAKK
jgi:outer membrane protein OmpA-like peptidoglycan-associated protein